MYRSASTLLYLLPALTLTVFPAHARNDYYFGDSDLEQGNYQIAATLTPEQRAPYFCAKGLCRDSNGPVWVEHLSPDVVPILAARAPYASLNFAVSGAHMTERGDSDLPIPTGVTRQIAQFGVLQDTGVINITAKDRFFIHAGTNDLMRVIEGEDAGTVQSDIITATADHVKALAARGAKVIVVAQIQPVQYLPLLRGDRFAKMRQAAAAFVADTNLRLVETLTTLRSSLPADTKLVLMDQPAFFEQLREHYSTLGFSTFDEPCYDPATGVLCSKDISIQNQHVFFDDNHLSAAAHVLLADWYRATLDADPGDPTAADISKMSNALPAEDDRTGDETDTIYQQATEPNGDEAKRRRGELTNAPLSSTSVSQSAAKGVR